MNRRHSISYIEYRIKVKTSLVIWVKDKNILKNFNFFYNSMRFPYPSNYSLSPTFVRALVSDF